MKKKFNYWQWTYKNPKKSIVLETLIILLLLGSVFITYTMVGK